MTAVSVLIATFNHARYLGEAIESVRRQTLPRPEFEIIVVDDGSTDDTRRILDGYRGEIVALPRAHEGVEAASNAGLALARGRYVVRVDSDDLVEPDLLAAEVAVLDGHPAAVGVSCDRYEDGVHGSRLVRVREDNLFDRIGCGVMMRTDDVRAVGGYWRTFWEEYDLFIRLSRRGRFQHVPRPLYRYRRHQSNRTLDDAQRFQGWTDLIERWGLDLLRSLGSHAELESAAECRGAPGRGRR